MGLSRSEQEALGKIETQLSRADPRLAATLAYGTTGYTRRMSARTALRRRWPDLGELVRFLIVLIGLAVVIGVAVAGVLTTHAARMPPGQRPANEVVPSNVSHYGFRP